MSFLEHTYRQLYTSGQALASRIVGHGRLVQVWQSLVLLMGLGAIAWALAAPAFRSDEGSLQGTFALPLSAGVALILLSRARQLRRFAFWAGLALVGQAAALQLIEAGKPMRYQHYLPFDQLLAGGASWASLVLLAQAALVGIGAWKAWPKLRVWLTTHFRWWQLTGMGAVFVLSSATVSHDVGRFVAELGLATTVQLVSLVSVLLAVAALPEQRLQAWKRRVEQVFGGPEAAAATPAPGTDRFALAGAAWVFSLAALLSFFSYQRHPHIPDEVIYIYQAEYFANGRLTMPAPPVKEAFEVYLMQFQGERWFPAPPPGWPAMLAVGVKLGVPWLVNPALGGLNLLLIYFLLGRLYSRRLARVATFLLCLSPWYVFMAMNFMTHTFTLTCALIAACGVIRARETGRAFWALLAGLALGMLSLIRPLEGLATAGLLGLWAIGIGGQRLKLASLAALGIGTAMVGGLVLPYNYVLTGSATTFPINAYTDEHFGPNSNAYGFGPDRGMGWPIDPNLGHDPIDALINANLNTFSINIELFGWSTGSLLLIALLAFSGSYQKADLVLAAVIAAIFAFFFFYYFSGGPDFGARYWYLMIVPLAALAARGVEYLERLARASRPGLGLADGRVLAGVVLLSGMALVNYFPWRAVDKYYHYLSMRPDVRELAQAYDFGRSLVLIQGDEHPDYASAAVYNPIDIYSDAPVFAWDRNPDVRAQVLRAYADRPVWLLAGPTVTGAGYEVVAGPVEARALLASQGSP